MPPPPHRGRNTHGSRPRSGSRFARRDREAPLPFAGGGHAKRLALKSQGRRGLKANAIKRLKVTVGAGVRESTVGKERRKRTGPFAPRLSSTKGVAAFDRPSAGCRVLWSLR